MSGLLAGVDLGGTSIKAAVADDTGDLLAQDAISTESHLGPASVLERTSELLRRLVAQTGHGRDELIGIGMGVPGLVDVPSGTTKFLPNLATQWRDVPVAAILGEHWPCPIRVLNDARTATLGELRFGHGRDRPNITLAFFSLGTGVGGGVAIDGRLRLGPLGAAGELGHQTILPEGLRCGCGNRGCLETLASGPAIAAEGTRLLAMGMAPKLHALVDGDASKVTTREMAMAAEQDDAIREALDRAATFIGIAAANVVSVLHPDVVVLGGGVAALGEVLLATVRSVVRERVGMFPTASIEIVKSRLDEQAGVMGAVALANTSRDRLV